MRYNYIAISIIILLFVGCAPEEQIEEPQETPEPEVEPKEELQPEQQEPAETIPEEPEEELQPEEEPEQEELELSEDKQIQQILDSAGIRIDSYSCKYKDPSGRQYMVYAKGNKIRIGDLSSDNKIYIDTDKKTAEEYCTSYTKCGREWGKIADLDYYDAYIETPLDWLKKITESEKIDEGSYYGKQSWKLNTNIGEVVIDEHFGFIYNIKQEDKEYLFTEASFNTVTDSDVTIPEHLLPENIG